MGAMEQDTTLTSIRSQEDLNDYIRKLPPKNKCVFTIDKFVPLCKNSLICPYKGKDEYTHLGERKRECKRETILRHKKLLGR